MAGGSDRAAALAAQRDAVTEKLISALEALTKATSDGSGRGNAGGAAGAPTPGTGQGPTNVGSGAGSGFGAPPPPAAKVDSATGLGMSAVRQVLSASSSVPGVGMASNILGGFASGGVAGAGAAAIAGAVSHSWTQMTGQEAAVNAGMSAFAGAPTSDTEGMARTRARSAFESGQLDLDEMDDESHKLALGGAELGRRKKTRAGLRRQLAQDETDELSPQERALEETRRQFAPIAAAGGMQAGPEGDAARRAADEMYQYHLERARGAQDFEKWARVRDKRMISGAPGNASGLSRQ